MRPTAYVPFPHRHHAERVRIRLVTDCKLEPSNRAFGPKPGAQDSTERNCLLWLDQASVEVGYQALVVSNDGRADTGLPDFRGVVAGSAVRTGLVVGVATNPARACSSLSLAENRSPVFA